MKKFSFSIFNKSCENILDPNGHTYKYQARTRNRPLTVADFPGFQQEKYANWVARNTFKDMVLKTYDLYIKLNHGSRAGSIAKIKNLSDVLIFNNEYNHFHYSKRVIIEFDCGKIVEIKGRNLFDNLKDEECADLLVGYVGKTIDNFTKKPRIVEPPAEIFDAHGRQINVGDWVMNDKFRPGKITRISPKGSMWVNYIALGIKAYWAKSPTKDSREGKPEEFLLIKTPEEMDTMSQIMDYDLSGFKMDYVVEFGTKDD